MTIPIDTATKQNQAERSRLACVVGLAVLLVVVYFTIGAYGGQPLEEASAQYRSGGHTGGFQLGI